MMSGNLIIFVRCYGPAAGETTQARLPHDPNVTAGRMKLSLFIALRYLFARKSHNVINVISGISAAGMAIGTAALVIILSVYNGFDRIIMENISDIQPDILIQPSHGKSFVPRGEAFDMLRNLEEVTAVEPVIEENVFLSYADRECTALARAVSGDYALSSGLEGHLVEGEFRLRFGELDECCAGQGLARELGIRTHFSDPVVMYYPDRTAEISLVDPTSSLQSAELFPSGIVSISADADAGLLYVPFDVMRDMMHYDAEVSAVEVWTDGDADKLVRRLSSMLGDDCRVLDRYHQDPDLYKVMRYEKAAIFLILLFVVLIVAFNIFGSLSMLIIEKRDDIEVLKALGAEDRLVRRIFVTEGWLISLLGLAVGLVLGIGITLLQQHFGIIKMPGSYLVDAYPVVLKFTDILVTAASVALVGYLIALIARPRSSSRAADEAQPFRQGD